MALPDLKCEIAFNGGPLDLSSNEVEFTDSFASNPTSPWVATGGTWTASGGKVGSSSVAGSTLLYPSTADGHIRCTVYSWVYTAATITATSANAVTATTPRSGIVFRYVDANNYWILDVITAAVYVVTAGAITATYSLISNGGIGSNVDGDTWDIYFNGNYIYIAKNDLFLTNGEINNSTYATAGTKHGFRADSDTIIKFAGFSFWGATVWTDVSPLVRYVSFGGGRNFEFDRMDARTGTVTFSNKDGRFDPGAQNAPAPYAGNILPNKRIRFSAVYNNVTYTLFYGLIENWEQSFPSGKGDYSEVVVRFTDMFRLLSETVMPRPYYQEVMLDLPDHYWRFNDVSPFGDSGFNPTASLDATKQTTSPPITMKYQPATKQGSGDVAVKCFRDDAAGTGYAGFLGVGSTPSVLNSLTYRTGDITFSGIIRLDDPGCAYADLISYFIDLPCQRIGLYKRNIADDYYRLFILWQGQTGQSLLVSKTTFKVGSSYPWHLIRSVSDGAFLLYVNGKYVETIDQDYSAGGGNPFSTTRTATIDDAAKPTTYPWSYMVLQEVGWYNITVSDIAIYRKRLPDARIKAQWLAYQDRLSSAASGEAIKRALRFAGVFQHLETLSPGETLTVAQDIPGPTPIKVTLLDGSTTVSSDNDGTSVLEYIQQISDSEDGQFFIADDGKFTFLDRWAKLQAPRTVSQATFGDGGGAEIGYSSDLQPVTSLDKVFTVAELDRTQVGGFVTRVEDPDAKRKYGARVFSRRVVNNSDADALDLATWVVYNSKTPKQRFDTITVYPQNGNTWATVLSLNIGDRITHKRRPTGAYYSGAAISNDYHIQGITHTYDLKRWVVVFAVSPVPSTYWTLGTSVLGTDTFLGY